MKKLIIALLGFFVIFTNFDLHATSKENTNISEEILNSKSTSSLKSNNINGVNENSLINVKNCDSCDFEYDYFSLEFYKMKFNGIYYVADVKPLFKNGVLECKLITNCSIYNNFDSLIDLRKEEYVLEIITSKNINDNLDEIKLVKSFYTLDENDAKKIVNKAKHVDASSNLYFELLSTLNVEYTFRSSQQKNDLCVTTNSVSTSSYEVDNQNLLEHYLAISKVNSDAGTITTEYSQNGFSYSSDDMITNLIPKSYFRTNGIRSGGGSEWGYFINTYDDVGNNNISSLLIYDIVSHKADSMSPDLTEIQVVVHKNFKYYYDSDVVVGDVDNNYCIGNPQFKASIKYFKPNNVVSAEYHPNPSDEDYDPLNDYGLSFGTVATKMHGRYKNNTINQGNIVGERLFKFLINLLSDAAVTGLLSLTNLSLGASFIASQVAGFITDSIVDSVFKKQEKSTPFYSLENNRYGFQNESFNDYANFNEMRINKALLKEIGIIVPNMNGNFDYTEKETPLLFKNEEDFISYRTNIEYSENNENYYGLISHSLKVDVFNDMSNAFLFRWNPDFLGTSCSKRAYTYGIDSVPKDATVQSNNNSFPLNFGKEHEQNILFTPKTSGTYYFHLTNVMPYTKIFLYDNKNTYLAKGEAKFINIADKWNNNIKIVEGKCLNFSYYLSSNKLYKIKVFRDNGNTKLSGTSELEVFKKSGVISGISSSLSYKRKVNSLSGDELNLLTFLPTSTDLYTFVASDDFTGVLDTFISIRDKNMNIIYESESGAGSSRAMLSLTLKSGETYYITSRNKTSSHSSYKLYTYKEDYLPYIRGQNKNIGYRMYFKGVKHFYYLIHFNYSFDGNLVVEFLTNNLNRTPVNVELIDYKGTKIYNYVINDSNNKTFKISSNTFYVFHAYTSSSSANEDCRINLG